MEIGVCGDNCWSCPRYTATNADKSALFAELLHLYIKAGLSPKGTKAEELRCLGCKTVEHCANYEVKACARDRGLDSCGKCRCYPCATINNVFEKSKTTGNRLRSELTSSEMLFFERAFFRKEENLNRIHKNTRP